MTESTNKLEKATQYIEESNNTLDDIVTLEMDSLSDLEQQKEILQKDKDILDAINNDLDTSNTYLKKMWMRVLSNKLIICLVGMTLLLAMATLLYYYIFSSIVGG
ncbi:hypothetical protein EIN_086800 [Entamoeba invadens IP1]|uniref:hypothetical protein n=1 Tax=Entamoeba invadens IP1 TaxID=370355 RepID=UPI0002C3D41D|nr:hypothetical protein EIN_086800 [Entamoeba invadens IP1]ELP85398.1 hypothetical protein EIN_086800 [Entamoeba invadens IP1]|eukprot:XP_004184744.1 hypothetical protein EIN_086800 [Entamoeba invadens IP1]